MGGMIWVWHGMNTKNCITDREECDMTIELLQGYIIEHGLMAVLGLIFVEYTGLPGYPGAVVLPAIGMISGGGLLSLPMAMGAAFIGASIATIVAYFFGFQFADWVMKRFAKNKKFNQFYIKLQKYLEEKGSVAFFIMRLIPICRVLSSHICGILRCDFKKYFILSSIGNAVYIGANILIGFMPIYLHLN